MKIVKVIQEESHSHGGFNGGYAPAVQSAPAPELVKVFVQQGGGHGHIDHGHNAYPSAGPTQIIKVISEPGHGQGHGGSYGPPAQPTQIIKVNIFIIF